MNNNNPERYKYLDKSGSSVENDPSGIMATAIDLIRAETLETISLLDKGYKLTSSAQLGGSRSTHTREAQ